MKKNILFLAAITVEARTQVLNAIAENYGITLVEAFEEVAHEDAENILEYLTGASRAAASVLMQKHGMR
jgi:ATP-dependent RNA circularization protein (DNA/RNA ligase family)